MNLIAVKNSIPSATEKAILSACTPGRGRLRAPAKLLRAKNGSRTASAPKPRMKNTCAGGYVATIILLNALTSEKIDTAAIMNRMPLSVDDFVFAPVKGLREKGIGNCWNLEI